MANTKRKVIGAVKCTVGMAQATACSVTETFLMDYKNETDQGTDAKAQRQSENVHTFGHVRCRRFIGAA